MKKSIVFTASLLFSMSIFAGQLAASTKTKLIVKPSIIVVNGKETKIYTIEQPDGTWGYIGTQGEEFNTVVENKTEVPITIHWHGLIVPSDQDGVPYISQNPIPPGGHYAYHFKLIQNGTYWMHSHVKFQMQEGLFAPLIIKSPHDPYAKAQDVTMLISDFSFKSPETINNELQHSNMPMHHHTPGMNMSMSSDKPDLNDVHYDAYLTNKHSLTNPQVVPVTPGKEVRLRIIDGGSASSFFIRLGKLKAKVIAADGNFIKPVSGSLFSISEGQRLDILVKIPKNSKEAYPILAQAEGTNQQTGLILATPGAAIPKLSNTSQQNVGAIDALQDMNFHALHSLPPKLVNEKITLSLEGGMSPYVWKINNEVWPKVTPIKVKKGDRIEMDIINKTNMTHPIHLHGHVFQVISVNGKLISDGPLRDTVLVPAHGSVKVIFDANNDGNWMLHCHVLYHSEDGMMTVMQYENMPNPKLMTH